MISRLLRILFALVIALGGGTYLTWHALQNMNRFDAVTLGGWTAYPLAGTPQADPFEKARLSRDATVSIGAAEGVEFHATADSSGEQLRSNCAYRIEGKAPPARFWTLHTRTSGQPPIHARESSLPLSIHSGNIVYRKDGSFVVSVSVFAQPDNWLAIPPDWPFQLVITLYDSPVAANRGLIETTFPTVRKADCHD